MGKFLRLTVLSDGVYWASVHLLDTETNFVRSCRLLLDVGISAVIFGIKLWSTRVTNVTGNAAFSAVVVGVGAIESTGDIFSMFIFYVRHGAYHKGKDEEYQEFQRICLESFLTQLPTVR